MEAARANKVDGFMPWLIMLLSMPVMIFKQWINVIQLVNASQWLAEGDRLARKSAGLGVTLSKNKKLR